jgi:DNA-directed RNA polymerase subunit RPC12/RpoP
MLKEADHYIIRLQPMPISESRLPEVIAKVLEVNGYTRGSATVDFRFDSSVDDAYVAALVCAYEERHAIDDARSRVHNISGGASGRLAAMFHRKDQQAKSGEVLECPSCGSGEVSHKTSALAVVIAVLGFMVLLGNFVDSSAPRGFSLARMSLASVVVALLMIGVGGSAWRSKHCRCRSCGKTFDDPTSPLKVRCPKCRAKLNGATKGMIGDTCECPKCKADFTIEEA